jgi:hypothetical protein
MRATVCCPSCGKHDSRLMTIRDIETEFGVSRRIAEGIMQRCPKLSPDWARRVYARREHVMAEIERWAV